jgi:rubrerythrin
VLEHLKTGFTAEAVSAAKYRAYAARAQADQLPNLADHWLRLAGQKDELARLQLEAAGKIRGQATDLSAAIADERYENDVLYPKMIETAGPGDAADLFVEVIEHQKDHLRALGELRDRLTAARGDVEMPRETADTGRAATGATGATAPVG